jgi:hypothetical protein
MFSPKNADISREDQVLLRLLSAAIRGQAPQLAGYDDIDWERVFFIARQHRLHTVIYPVLDLLDPPEAPHERLYNNWKKSSLYCSIDEINSNKKIENILKEFINNDIRFIILKGIYLQGLYPYPETRFMADHDILVHAGSFKQADRIIRESGYLTKDTDETVYVYSKLGHKDIELHLELFKGEEYAGAGFSFNRLWSNGEEASFGRLRIKVFSVDDNLLYMMLHFIKHIISRIPRLKHLLDLALFIEKNNKQIDWDYFWDNISRLSYGKISTVILLACKSFLGLDISIRGIDNISDRETYLFMDILLRAGPYREKGNTHSAGNAGKPKSWFWRPGNKIADALCFLFPGYNIMKKRNSYLKRFPFLLPVAWLSRIKDSVFEKRHIFNDINRLMDIAEYKRAFLNRMDL